jgi:hypothetical protein
MALEREQIRTLVAAVSATRGAEIDCDECLAGMAEFAEAELVDTELSDALQRVREHLVGCPECAEEYALLEALLQRQDEC